MNNVSTINGSKRANDGSAAGGVLTFLLLFIFAKRQIMRFTLRSHRTPHAPFGQDANKVLRREILRRIDAIQKITYEPQVLRDEVGNMYIQDGKAKPCHYYRMKAVDDAKSLEMAMVKKKLGKRHSFESLRSYVIVLLTPQIDPRIVHQFCDLYEAARFNGKPFTEEDYKAFTQLLKQLRHTVSTLQPKSSVRSPSKGTTMSSKPTLPAPVTNVQSQGTEEKNAFESLAAPYIRKLTKKDKSKWTQSRATEEEQALCDSAAALHEISIICPSKDESTAV
ncbi:unnamed protein product [Allacma fusca]|uniref:Uncharacterized protein n=1 Tax=Allacma fusca TaxID=39272 RepID=A0A8J2K7P7_9HEXA|nr:unnamed protein product [Allacma fusca]